VRSVTSVTTRLRGLVANDFSIPLSLLSIRRAEVRGPQRTKEGALIEFSLLMHQTHSPKPAHIASRSSNELSDLAYVGKWNSNRSGHTPNYGFAVIRQLKILPMRKR